MLQHSPALLLLSFLLLLSLSLLLLDTVSTGVSRLNENTLGWMKEISELKSEQSACFAKLEIWYTVCSTSLSIQDIMGL